MLDFRHIFSQIAHTLKRVESKSKNTVENQAAQLTHF